MSFFYRKDIKTNDFLDCPEEALRVGFMNSAKTIGKFVTNNGNTTAHILHVRPLIIAAISSEETGRFFPESPGLYESFTNCKVTDKDKETNYSIYECEDMVGAYYKLASVIPKIKPKENLVILAYQNQKVITKNEEVVGGIVTDLGTNEVYEVVGENGRIPVDKFRDLYDRAVWPTAKVYFKNVRSHYFTYFREYEVKYNLSFSGLEGTRYRRVDGNLRWNIFKGKAKAWVKSLIGL